MWAAWTCGSRLSSGKLPRGVPEREGASQDLNPTKVTDAVAAAIQPSAAVIQGVLNNKEVDLMLESGSSISLIEGSVMTGFSTEGP